MTYDLHALYRTYSTVLRRGLVLIENGSVSLLCEDERSRVSLKV